MRIMGRKAPVKKQKEVEENVQQQLHYETVSNAWPTFSAVVLAGVLFRWAVSAGPYSGMNTPPLFGDFEAQRHWMEITYNLPIEDWYVNTTDNDLNYWGLDYPPLTAYHSWVMGAIASKINSSWVELYESRGLESYEHKLFMRYSVFLTDMLLFLPAMLIYSLEIQSQKTNLQTKALNLAILLLYPGFILIDYGHFQYNCASLGFLLWAVLGMFGGWHCTGAVLFVMAINYKQMELYHSLPFFFYLLGVCTKELTVMKKFGKLVKIATAVLVVFGVIWWPFLKDIELALQVLRRIFPFARGIYEDKVANFWCASSILVKWKLWLPMTDLAKISAAVCLVTTVPSCLMTMVRPTMYHLQRSLLICSLAFFLFSFQVHEKTILLAALPALMLQHERSSSIAVMWFCHISVISLHPLCVKDGIQTVFGSLSIFYYYFTSSSLNLFTFYTVRDRKSVLRTDVLFYHLTCFIGYGLCITSNVFEPPTSYLYLFPTLNSIYCFVMFLLFFLYCYKVQCETFMAQRKAKVE